jgi:hypothetical protein
VNRGKKGISTWKPTVSDWQINQASPPLLPVDGSDPACELSFAPSHASPERTGSEGELISSTRPAGARHPSGSRRPFLLVHVRCCPLRYLPVLSLFDRRRCHHAHVENFSCRPPVHATAVRDFKNREIDAALKKKLQLMTAASLFARNDLQAD